VADDFAATQALRRSDGIRADVLLAFSNSPENPAAVAELIGSGWSAAPYA